MIQVEYPLAIVLKILGVILINLAIVKAICHQQYYVNQEIVEKMQIVMLVAIEKCAFVSLIL